MPSGGRRAAPFTRTDELAAILRGARPEVGCVLMAGGGWCALGRWAKRAPRRLVHAIVRVGPEGVQRM